MWGFKLFIKKNIITTTKNTKELLHSDRHVSLAIATYAHISLRMHNVPTLQNITEHYPPKTEHYLYINDLTQNIRLIGGSVRYRALAKRHRSNWLHNMLCRGITTVPRRISRRFDCAVMLDRSALAKRHRSNWLQMAARCWLTAG